MVNNTHVGGHLHGFVIDLENSLGYSIKFIHDSRDGREEGEGGYGLDKSFKGDAPCGNALEAFRTNVVVHTPVAVLEFRGEFNYPRAFDAIILHDITP